MQHKYQQKRHRSLNFARIEKCQKRRWHYFSILPAKLSELGRFRRFHVNLMQIKITWLDLGWQYHVAKQFLLGNSLVRIRVLSVCPEQAARMFVQFCLFGLRASISSLTDTCLRLDLTTYMYAITIGPSIVCAAPVLPKTA